MFLKMHTVPLKSKDNCWLTVKRLHLFKFNFLSTRIKILTLLTEFVKEFSFHDSKESGSFSVYILQEHTKLQSLLLSLVQTIKSMGTKICVGFT